MVGTVYIYIYYIFNKNHDNNKTIGKYLIDWNIKYI